MGELRLRTERHEPGDRETVHTILADLPAWFGRPEATAGYVDAADRLPADVAVAPDGEAVGVLLVEQHFPETAELHLMAVKAAWHRRGVGRALLAAVERDLVTAGTRLLTVKTLGPSDPDEGYRRTRLFYEAQGFLRLEELMDLWPGTACLVMAKPLA
ncbi:GNAT family N-acetyltransferase [Cellulomonas fimi]|nr:GNAT family N-acetyltransferase [Cellulomonas fimi]NNH07952.1 GNAT family N-acetyltransferase [Cellulomonas fimi]